MPKDLICPVPALAIGTHKEDEEERCLWEAVNVALTGKLSDKCPDCTHPVLHSLLMRANDTLPDEPRQLLWPYAMRALGTKDRDSVEIAFACADTAIRVFAADAMDSAGLPHEAKILRALPPIDSGAAAWSARSAAESAAESARSAAWSAARSAAWSARSAAESAWSARSAAESARSAAESAAWSAAESARSAAESAWSKNWFLLLDKLLPQPDVSA